jgi:FkbM family methyltransferase
MIEYIPHNSNEYLRWIQDNGDKTKRLDYDLNEDSVVFDVGGYQGEWAKDIYNKYKSNIYIFEPVEDFYKDIKQTFKSIGKVKVYKFGLGDKTENQKLFFERDASSLFNHTDKYFNVDIVDINDFIKKNNISNIDLLKLNIEGSEYDLLDSLIEQNYLSKIKNLQIQFHRNIIDCSQRRDSIRNELSKTHKLTYDYSFIWENWQLN